MMMESNGELHPVEIKRSVNPGTDLVGAFRHLDKGSVPRGTGSILCMRPELSAINTKNLIAPILRYTQGDKLAIACRPVVFVRRNPANYRRLISYEK